MYNPSLHKQLIATRTDHIRRALHNQHAILDHAVSGGSPDNARHRDFRLPVIPRRLVARIAH